MAGEIEDVVGKAIKENAETAAYILGGFILYKLAAPWLNQLLSFIPAVIRPGVVGILALVAGVMLKQPILIGIGGGAIAYNIVTVALPIVDQATAGIAAAVTPQGR